MGNPTPTPSKSQKKMLGRVLVLLQPPPLHTACTFFYGTENGIQKNLGCYFN